MKKIFVIIFLVNFINAQVIKQKYKTLAESTTFEDIFENSHAEIDDQKIMYQYKKYMNNNHDGNVKVALKPVLEFIDAPKKNIFEIAKKLLMMSMAEKWIKENPAGTAQEFKKLPPQIFNEIKNSNLIADILKGDIEVEFIELIISNNLIFDHGMGDNFKFERISDLYNALDEKINTTDTDSAKILKDIKINLILIERNYRIIRNLTNRKIIDEQRPLYFFKPHYYW
tara:strand:- start:562 stop:1242 length:681 start_codon:yes stop_codon:yes gene_type:complete